jgi:asparagine synthase (glutamine-hydrolysing)
MMTAAFEAISDRGHRVVLTGAGGDFVFSGSPFQYADLLRAGRPAAAVRRFIDDWRADDTGHSPLGFVQAGLWPILPSGLKAALRPLARRAYGVKPRPDWIRLPRKAPPQPAAPRGDSYATEEVTRRLGSGLHAFFLESHERSAAERGVEIRNPLLDRRLVEFALNIPDDQRRRGPYTKYVLRNALAGHLAGPVLKRRTKADFSHGITDALEALGGDAFFGRLQIAAAGWVDPGPILALYRRTRRARQAGDPGYGTHVPALWMIAAVELWFRALGASAAVQPGKSIMAKSGPEVP